MKKTILFLVLIVFTTLISAAPVFVKMETNRGDIFLELDQDKAPLSVANFLQYAKDGFYEGTVFHRVINNFMIQGGGYDEDLNLKTTREPIKNEAFNGLKNLKGTIAMARRPDPQSATSQFYINVQDNPALDYTGKANSRTWGYAVFGKVIKGLDTVEVIKLTPTAAYPPFPANVPIKTMRIKKVILLEKSPLQESTK